MTGYAFNALHCASCQRNEQPVPPFLSLRFLSLRFLFGAAWRDPVNGEADEMLMLPDGSDSMVFDKGKLLTWNQYEKAEESEKAKKADKASGEK